MLVARQTHQDAEERSPTFLSSSVGRKVVMALSGVILFGFVTVHMIGNLQAYAGREVLNQYAELLHAAGHGAAVWIFRGVLLTAVLLHSWSALTLTLDNRKARAIGYRVKKNTAASLSSLTMRWTGVLLAVFILYHLAHLTIGNLHSSFVKGDAYQNFVAGFRDPGASAFYLVAQLCLGLHMVHGVWSFTQTLGLSHPRYAKARRAFASVLTLVVVGVNVSYPIAVLTGVIR